MRSQTLPENPPILNKTKKLNLHETSVKTTSLSTPKHQIMVHFPFSSHQKSTLKPRPSLCYPRTQKSQENDTKVEPTSLPKSIENRQKSSSGPQGVPYGTPGSHGSSKCLPRIPKWSLQASKMTGLGTKSWPYPSLCQSCQSCKFCKSFQSCQSPVNQSPEEPAAVGVALKIYTLEIASHFQDKTATICEK